MFRLIDQLVPGDGEQLANEARLRRILENQKMLGLLSRFRENPNRSVFRLGEGVAGDGSERDETVLFDVQGNEEDGFTWMILGMLPVEVLLDKGERRMTKVQQLNGNLPHDNWLTLSSEGAYYRGNQRMMTCWDVLSYSLDGFFKAHPEMVGQLVVNIKDLASKVDHFYNE